MGRPGPLVVVDHAKVRHLRLRRGWSQAVLAATAGVSKPTVHHMENPRSPRGCTPATLELVAEALGVEPADLLPADPVHEVACPSCGTSIRARMADA